VTNGTRATPDAAARREQVAARRSPLYIPARIAAQPFIPVLEAALKTGRCQRDRRLLGRRGDNDSIPPQALGPMDTSHSNRPCSLRDLAQRNGISPEAVASRLGITEAQLQLFDGGLATIAEADLPHAAARIHWNCQAEDVKAAIGRASEATKDAPLLVSIPAPAA